MAVEAVKPGFISSLPQYLEQRDQEYQALAEARLAGGRSSDDDGLLTFGTPDRCMLTHLPPELLLLVFDRLYQADLCHLAMTCRALVSLASHVLHTRDITDFDCLALRWACTVDNVPTLQRALGFGAPVDHVFDAQSHISCVWIIGGDTYTTMCNTPLTTAIVVHASEVVRVLLAHGANVNLPDPRKADPSFTRACEVLYPIHVAMGAPDMPPLPSFQPGNPRIIQQLLDAKARPNQYTVHRGRRFSHAPGVRGYTPLIMAMQAQVPVETVQLLLEHGADPSRLGIYQGTYLFPARDVPCEVWNRSPLGVLLLPACNRSSAVFPVDLPKIRLLLAYGAVNELSYVRRRRLDGGAGPDCRVPVLCNHWFHDRAADVLRLFLAAGADLAGWAGRGHPPFLSVVWWGEKAVAAAARAEAPAQQVPGVLRKMGELMTLMAEATLVPSPPPCHNNVRRSALIDAVVPADMPETTPSRRGQTALRYLCGPLRSPLLAVELVPLLLHYGADPTLPDANGRTAVHHAAMFGEGDALSFLLAHLHNHSDGPGGSGLSAAVHVRDARGWTPLHYACLFGLWRDRAGQVARARMLLERGAEVGVRTRCGWTPFAFAVVAGNAEVVRLLLEWGAEKGDLVVPPGWAGDEGGEGDGTGVVRAPVGRIVFLRRDEPGWTAGPPLPDVAAELADARVAVAAVLESRLGVTVELPLEEDPPCLPGAIVQWDAFPRIGDAMAGVTCLYLGGLGTAGTFEREVEGGVLETLGLLGLGRWMSFVRSGGCACAFWYGDRPRALGGDG